MSAAEQALEQQDDRAETDARGNQLAADIADLIVEGLIIPEDLGVNEPVRYSLTARGYLDACVEVRT
jgi:hypothetical protein